jgi:hypothetical protein
MKYIVQLLVVIAALSVATAALAQDGPHGLVWRGTVDDKTIVYIHADNVTDRTVSGKGTANVDDDFYGRLPQRPIQVFLTTWKGRGRVRIVRQPDERNDFTAAVLISDPQPGSSVYTFSLSWKPRGFAGGRDRF